MATNKFIREFVSEEKRNYKVRLGYTLASSLAGLVCGVILASVIWLIAFNYIINTLDICPK